MALKLPSLAGRGAERRFSDFFFFWFFDGVTEATAVVQEGGRQRGEKSWENCTHVENYINRVEKADFMIICLRVQFGPGGVALRGYVFFLVLRGDVCLKVMQI